MLVGCFFGVFYHTWALLGLVLIRAGVKHAHKRFARTACRKTTSMPSGIPYQNCPLLRSAVLYLGLTGVSFFVACSWDTVRAQPFTLFAVTIVRTTS